MLQDHEIADQYTLKPIQEVAASLNIQSEHLLPYGHDKGKISLKIYSINHRPQNYDWYWSQRFLRPLLVKARPLHPLDWAKGWQR